MMPLMMVMMMMMVTMMMLMMVMMMMMMTAMMMMVVMAMMRMVMMTSTYDRNGQFINKKGTLACKVSDGDIDAMLMNHSDIA